ncbi:hypothetical protein XENTR_v10006082 [Xenopus tropicalis]|nr:hypothetical protein XENTR_v10006082 [Xenopus tropicalis]
MQFGVWPNLLWRIHCSHDMYVMLYIRDFWKRTLIENTAYLFFVHPCSSIGPKMHAFVFPCSSLLCAASHMLTLGL